MGTLDDINSVDRGQNGLLMEKLPPLNTISHSEAKIKRNPAHKRASSVLDKPARRESDLMTQDNREGAKVLKLKKRDGSVIQTTADEVLDKMHKLRLKTLETRDPNVEDAQAKPYLPMLESDEKQLILEKYFESKKKLNKII